MEGAFDINMRIALCLNHKLPYGDKSPEIDFVEAAINGDLSRLREMARGKDAKAKARLAEVAVGGLGSLQAAARLGRLDVVRCLVEELGFDINAGTKEHGITALASAALDGKLDTVRYLLDNWADPNKKDDQGSVPLHCAAKMGMMKWQDFCYLGELVLILLIFTGHHYTSLLPMGNLVS